MVMQGDELAVRATAVIAASAEQVWRVLADLRSYHQWHPSLELLDGPAAADLSPGTVLRLRADRGSPGEREFDVIVTEVAQSTALAWEGGDPQVFFGRHRFTLTPEAEGTRLLDEELFTGAMAQAVLAGRRGALEACYQANATALKATVEGRR
jgi:uncharacterized protein YndB with AHSA1/START domain